MGLVLMVIVQRNSIGKESQRVKVLYYYIISRDKKKNVIFY